MKNYVPFLTLLGSFIASQQLSAQINVGASLATQIATRATISTVTASNVSRKAVNSATGMGAKVEKHTKTAVSNGKNQLQSTNSETNANVQASSTSSLSNNKSGSYSHGESKVNGEGASNSSPKTTESNAGYSGAS